MFTMDVYDTSPLDQEGDLSDYEFYSKTPPRTKILRKNRERKHPKNSSAMAASPKVVKAKHNFGRRNTISNMFEELVAKADGNDSDHGTKRSNKRHMKLLRGSERDLKLDITSAQQAAYDKSFKENQPPPKTPQPSFQIESHKRFMSLSCRTVPCFKKGKCNKSKTKDAIEDDTTDQITNDECPSNRVDFYNTFNMLIKMGCGDKQSQEKCPRRLISREEHLWQNELKDLIWLELQAFHADRTLNEEDTYICTARESVEPLLHDIMSYRFKRQSKCYSTQNSDSGVEDDCTGCLSMYCGSCLEAQNEALKDIEELMQRLEFAESLFPSSHAFAELYPLYNSPEFEARVKAISLWYNMTKHQRLKLIILGKLMEFLEHKNSLWPLREECVESTSPSDSNSSSASSANDYLSDSKACIDFHNFTIFTAPPRTTVSPYRKYIENILKTRTLYKSLSFLDKLQVYVLRKVQLTLEKPEEEDIFSKNSFKNEEEELQRYGCWSPEAKALSLPSYRACFLFLACIPLEVIHEFLKLRLEQKPANPSPLSVRQLMRELKDGLKVATDQKQKIIRFIESAVSGTKESIAAYTTKLKDYDECMLLVFSDYLDYLEQWALLDHQTFQKNLLEEEWYFSLQIIEHIPGGSELLATKFSQILCSILKTVSTRLKERVEFVLSSIPKNDSNVLKQNLFAACRELQSLFNEEREMAIKTIAFCKTVFKHDVPDEPRYNLKFAIISLKCSVPQAIGEIQSRFDQINLETLDDLERSSLISRMREILMQGYRFGFEFYKEMSENTDDSRGKLVGSMVHFANLWMKFVTERCERGRGMRPRWAYQGLEFLLAVCEPRNTKYLTDEEFEDLKKNMDICISHVIGTTAPSTPESGFYSASPRSSIEHMRARSRGSSPSPRPTYKSQRSSQSRKTSMEQGSPVADHLDAVNFNQKRDDVKIKLPPNNHSERCAEAIEQLENHLDDHLRKQQLIGKVINRQGVDNRTHIRKRHVQFTWQRGIKIGQGRFGKVYTAVNNSTGEMMAVKEIALQHNDTHTIKRIAEEMKILEGIVHRNLVRYYGVEVHKDEMLIFMEFCAEGTLEQLVAASENGLSELLLRKYTYQLVSGVCILHEHGIVHRDIKTANIFLTDGGNCLKIGDFGCAAKIKSHSTMPGELQGFVGTQAYMAPEVFTKNMSEGHGRAADIWSVGCVVVEMASGKRPWSQYDSNYQIMFKVGMGESPDPPDNMTDEGLDFLVLCFQHNPKDRATAEELLDHSFVKVGDDLL